MYGLPDDYSKYFGYYTHPDQPSDQPAHNPGLEVGCPFCPHPLTERSQTTVSLMDKPDSAVSFFYRAHTDCLKRIGPKGEEEFEKPLKNSAAWKAKRTGTRSKLVLPKGVTLR